LYVNSKNEMHVEIKKLKLGSPGQKNPAVARYDPSGLRSSMTATWGALSESTKKYYPHHLPTPAWIYESRTATDENGKQVVVSGWDLLNAECEEKGIPYRLGKPQKLVPKHPLQNVW
jgi:hypothetical protein